MLWKYECFRMNKKKIGTSIYFFSTHFHGHYQIYQLPIPSKSNNFSIDIIKYLNLIDLSCANANDGDAFHVYQWGGWNIA